MTEFEQLRARARALRSATADAEATLATARGAVAGIDAEIRHAADAGDSDALAAALGRRGDLVEEERAAAADVARARGRLGGLITDVIGGLAPADVLAGVDRDLPILLLPIRLETRFDDDADSGRVLRVRIYPDDVHIDDHEPALSPDELSWGRAYWSAVAAGVPEADAWAGLVGRTGAYRAVHVRETLTPAVTAAEPQFPDVPVRPAGTSRAAVARALPDVFIARVRAGGITRTVHGKPVADDLQVGVDMSGAAAEAEGPTDATVLGEGMRWMTDYEAAEAAGMAITVPLPPGTEFVDDVTVVGVAVSVTPDEAAGVVAGLLAAHRVTNGAAFIPPGTPTNNLADTTSGFSSRPDPSRLDPATRPVVDAESNAGVLARALGLPLDTVASLPGAADRDDAEARAFQRVLFETTWGPYLRQLAQPGFPLKLMPRVYSFVTEYVRGGGPLPAMRLGRQPYGILPIAAAGWRPKGDDAFVTWLGETLPDLRRFWLAGAPAVPTGLAAYSHEAVSSRVRIRTSHMSSTQKFFSELGLGEEDTSDLGQRRLLAEIGISGVLPHVVTQLFTRGHVDLWLPMSVDGDTDVRIKDPKPKEATSILGLLLRNAALQVTSAAADEYRAGMMPGIDRDAVAYAARLKPVATISEAAGVAVATGTEFSTDRVPAFAELLELEGRDATGSTVRIGAAIDGLLVDGRIPDLEVYANSDAVIAFRAALAAIAAIPTDRRARLTGEVLDTASHRYDAWVTALATRRLERLRAARPTGTQLGAWGVVLGVRRRPGTSVPDRPDLPSGTVTEPANKGFVLAPSVHHATVAGVLRAAYIAHGGPGGTGEAPFAVSLESRRVRAALDLATGMRNGQPLGALLGYQLERHLHDVSGGGVEVDWMVFELRRRFPLKVTSGEQATAAAQRLVADGWAIVQRELDDPGVLAATVAAGRPAAERDALQEALAALVGSLDGLTDLALAEAMHQLAGRNLDRAAAATDMVGRATLPPDRFDVAVTPRGGRGIEQRLLLGFGDSVRPSGWASDTPRASLAPEADAFVAERLGPAATIAVRLVDAEGGELATCTVADLGLSALDLAADAARAGAATPFALVLDRARRATSRPEAVALALDAELDAALIDLLAHAAAWHRALAGRAPLGPGSVRLRGEGTSPDAHDDVREAIAAARTAFLAAPAGELPLWGLDVPAPAAAGQREARIAAVDAAPDPVAAARAIFGGDAVVTGATGPLPAELAASLADQAGLGTDDRGVVAAWLQDSARVRDAAAALDEALLHGEAAALASVPLAASQVPAMPYVDAGGGPAESRSWIGGAVPDGLELGRAPALTAVIAGPAAPAGIVGLELDAWSEVVPATIGTAAIAANLSAPDSRAPNTILLAVPGDLDAAWTESALFSVVDEALSLATCRAVDLDATRRIPALLPAVYVSEYEEPTDWREVVGALREFPNRYVRKGES